MFLFLFFLGSVSAISLNMGPPQIDLSGAVNEKICSSVSIRVDNSSELVGKILWAEEGFSERNLNLHSLSSDDLRISSEFERNIFVDRNKTIDFCIRARKPGNYHGALLYKVKDKPVRVGIWVNASIEGNSMIKITGNSVNKMDISFNQALFYLPIFLILVLALLLFFSRRKREKKLFDKDEKVFDVID